MGTIRLSAKEQRKAEVISRVATRSLPVERAAELLGLSQRQVRRLRAVYQERGIAGMVHGNRERVPKNQTEDAVKAQIRQLCDPGGPYPDFNVCHLQEALAERHQIHIGRSTLDRLLKEEGLRKCKRNRPLPRRSRRERCPALGQMLQIDGSPHDWLEARGPRMSLVGAIDDATSKVMYARFSPTEDQNAYMVLLRSVCLEHGIPLSIYHDRHSILRSPKEPTLDEQLQGVKPMSQVQRVMEELGIEAIPAGSPQAKGRVERLWKTLQDRLVKEMRLSGIKTLDEANAFLPAFLARFNARFSQEPEDKDSAFVPLPEDADLSRLFSTRESRTVASDHTLSFHGKTFQLLKGKGCLAGRKVDVHVTPEGDTIVYDGKRRLDYRALSQKPKKTAIPAESCVPGVAGTQGSVGIPNPPDPSKSAWGEGFQVFHHGPSPDKDLDFYNKLAQSGGHFP